MIDFFSDPALQTVALGTSAIGALAGFIGTFAVVRRQSLQGDAISHAALPGLALMFLFGARSIPLLVLGAAISGWIAMMIVGGLERSRRVTFDTALGGALAVFFGIGLSLLTAVKRYVPDAAEHGLERYLFGQAATLLDSDIYGILFVGAITILVVMSLWKPIQLICFDPQYALVQGWPVRLIDSILTALIVTSVVVGLQAVGVVLMSSLLVAPAVAAKPWQNSLGSLAILAAVFGATAGFFGTIGSHWLSRQRTVPTGPMIVLVATTIVALSFTVAGLRKRRRVRTI